MIPIQARENIEEIIENFILEAQRRGWHEIEAKYGVRGVQSLLTHSLNTVSVALAISEVAGWKGDLEALIAACIIHDYGKIWWDRRGPHEKYLSDKRKEEVRRLLLKIGVSEESVRRALSLYSKAGVPSSARDVIQLLEGESLTADEVLIAELADALAGIKLVDFESELYGSTLEKLKSLGLNVTYHAVSIIRGISTQLLHNAMVKLYMDSGFKPILYYPNGVVYIGRYSPPSFTSEQVLETLRGILKEFIEMADVESLASAAIGSPVQKPIRSIEYILLSGDSVRAFWRKVEQSVLERKYRFKDEEIDGRGDYPELLAERYDWNSLERGEREALLRCYIGVRTFFIYFNYLIKEVDSRVGGGAASSIAKSHFISRFGFDPPRVRIFDNASGKEKSTELLTFGNTTDKRLVVEALYKFLHRLNLDFDLKGAVGSLCSYAVEVTSVLAGKFGDRVLSGLFKPLEQLINDLFYPPLQSFDWYRKSYLAYTAGKSGRGTPVCVVCGNKSSVVGTAKTHGKGVQSFHNLILGGSVISQSNKAMFCDVCNFEAVVRSLLVDGWASGDVLYIVPQVNVTPFMLGMIWEKMKDVLNIVGGEKFNWDRWARIVLEDKISEDSSRIIAYYFSLKPEKEKEMLARELARILREKYGDDLEIACAKYNVEAESFETLAEQLIREGLVEGDTMRKAYSKCNLRAILKPGNYVVVLVAAPIRAKRGRDYESETSALIRKIFFALVLARLFHSSVVIPEMNLSILPGHVRPRGYLRIPGKLGLKPLLQVLGLSGADWVPLKRVDEVLGRLASLVLAERLMPGDASYGKDTLLELANRHPGMVLQRATSGRMLGRERLVQLVDSLGRYWWGVENAPGKDEKT